MYLSNQIKKNTTHVHSHTPHTLRDCCVGYITQLPECSVSTRWLFDCLHCVHHVLLLLQVLALGELARRIKSTVCKLCAVARDVFVRGRLSALVGVWRSLARCASLRSRPSRRSSRRSRVRTRCVDFLSLAARKIRAYISSRAARRAAMARQTRRRCSQIKAAKAQPGPR